ncbi:F-box protein At3g07870-like [Papaver somniferum]|uniref:F-box protein At3g07870-like n=1 Tax=Papaver somniferum TaxID=3469 RepID=UPI000E6F4B03|nr:F-box protein At3g07870-like [Papaver somniferum]
MKGLNSLPEGIILDILTRVPTESVLDFKLVCKPWKDLIRHLSFSQLHFNHHDSADDSGKPSFIFLTGENSDSDDEGVKELYYTEYDENCHETPFNRKTRINLNPQVQNYYFIGSSNGLICFNSYGGVTSDNVNEHHYGPAYICNPITREYIILPNLQGQYMWNGFGYSRSTNEYKVVRICFDFDKPNFGIPQVYTLGSGNVWRNLGESDMKLKNMKRLVLCVENILAFNLNDEKFSELPPPPCGVPDFAISLGVLGDFLSATYYSDYHNVGGCEIWLLKKNEDNCNELSWSKEFRFDPFDSYVSLPFGYTKSGRLLFYGHSKIYIYNPEASSTNMDVNFGKVTSKVISHKNTLVSLKPLGEKDTKTMESDERASASEVKDASA